MLPRRVFLINIKKKGYLLYYAYRISHQKFLSQVFSVTPRVSPHKISQQRLIHHCLAQAIAHHLTSIKLLPKKVHFVIEERNQQKMMTSKETRLTVAIVYLIISEGIYFNLDPKPRFKKVIGLGKYVSKSYQPQTKNIYLRIFGYNSCS